MFNLRPFFKYSALGLGVMLASAQAFGALEKGATASLSSEWEDNANRSSFDRESDLVTNVRLDLNAGEDFGKYEYGVLYNMEHRRYANGSFDNTNYLNGTAFLNLHLIPQRFFWDNRISSAVTLRNAAEPDIPDNRDQRNSIYTAPRFVVIRSVRDNFSVSANATKIMFREVGQNDNTRVGADAVYSHLFTPLVSGGFSCNGESARFDFEGDYDNYSCYINAGRRINNGNISLAIGKSVLNPEEGEKIDGLVYNARVNWAEENSSFYFTARRNITDTSFGIQLVGFDADFTPIIFNTEVIYLTRRTRAELGGSRTISPVTTLSGYLYWDLDDVEDNPADTTRTGIGFVYAMELAGDYRLRFNYRFEKTEFHELPEFQTIDFTSNYRLTLNRSFSRQIDGELFLTAEDRRADAAIDEYEVYGVGASVSYTF